MGGNSKIRIFLLGAFFLSLIFVLNFHWSNSSPGAPTISSLGPANGENCVSSSTYLYISFSEDVNASSGNIYIKKISDDSVFDTIAASSSNVYGCGSANITITPNVNFVDGGAYYVEIDSTAFMSTSTGEYFAGITGSSTWSFTSANRGVMVEMVKDINPLGNAFNLGSYDSTRRVSSGGYAYFWATDGTNGYELWRSDGTASGTAMIKDINPSGDSSPQYLAAMGSYVYFAANDGVNGVELWRSDGTSGGTAIVKDINPSGHSYPQYLTVLGSYVYFAADNGSDGVELWRSDGTEVGTEMIADINSGGNFSPSRLTAYGGELYFRADDGSNGAELWKSAGTATTTNMVLDINSSGESLPDYLTLASTSLYFTADDGVNGVELWKTDGTASGTVIVKDISPTGDSSPYNLTDYNGWLIFAALDDTYGVEVFKSDGTASNTVMVKDINVSGDSTPTYFIAHENFVLFGADDGVNGIELWKTQGNASGTEIVKNINATGDSSPEFFIGFNDEVYFSADNGINGRGIWKTHGSEDDTQMVYDINPAGASSPQSPLAVGGSLYFAATDGTHGAEVWRLRYLDYPTLTAKATINSIGSNSINLTSAITDTGGRSPVAAGFVVSASPVPLIYNSVWNAEERTFGIESFSNTVSGLTCETGYYARGFAINLKGFGYDASSTYFTTGTCVCPSIPHAIAYIPNPVCGASACEDGYQLSGEGAAAVCVEAPAADSYLLPLAVKKVPLLVPAEKEDEPSTETKTPSVTAEESGGGFLPVADRVGEIIAEQANALKAEAEAERIKREQFARKLAGYVLIEAQRRGELWYVNPGTDKRYYIGNPTDMFSVMRNFSLGATHEFVSKNEIFPDRLKGKILLDVQDKGKAYYINPISKKKHYLGRPNAAIEVIKSVSLGISDSSLGKILADRLTAKK